MGNPAAAVPSRGESSGCMAVLFPGQQGLLRFSLREGVTTAFFLTV